MEIQSPRVDGCHNGNCDLKHTRAWSSETYRHRVPLGTGDGHRRQDLAWKEAHQGNACRSFNETRRRCNDAEFRDWIGIEISIR